MKRAICVLLFALCFIFLSGFSSAGLFGDKINRTANPLFPRDSRFIEKAYVHLEKGYAYHISKHCDTEEQLLGLKWDALTEMSEYEAIYRGFFKCPDCAALRTLDKYDIETIIEDTVESAIANTLIEIFSE